VGDLEGTDIAFCSFDGFTWTTAIAWGNERQLAVLHLDEDGQLIDAFLVENAQPADLSRYIGSGFEKS